MAAEEVIVTIVVIAVLGMGLAWLVGILADRDKRKRAEAGETIAPLGGGPPASASGAGPLAPTGIETGMCPTCRTAYRPDLSFCWACGREKDA